ncbi:hypothetical protein IAE22_32580, partial [Bacillus sp. S34]|nr:hypothetical protein [Bacillus sp. S34]
EQGHPHPGPGARSDEQPDEPRGAEHHDDARRWFGLRVDAPEVARAVIVPVGTLIAFAFTVVPLVVGRSDQFDPRRFTVFGIGRRDLAVGLRVAIKHDGTRVADVTALVAALEAAGHTVQ